MNNFLTSKVTPGNLWIYFSKLGGTDKHFLVFAHNIKRYIPIFSLISGILQVLRYSSWIHLRKSIVGLSINYLTWLLYRSGGNCVRFQSFVVPLDIYFRDRCCFSRELYIYFSWVLVVEIFYGFFQGSLRLMFVDKNILIEWSKRLKVLQVFLYDL